ncbi:MAG: bifunctional diaminohydroxyphosphoribosylaminopyrimidine deaminase/5-amino-6-(5-phosphoribosylamino)uracil reductase RibD [Candidatus Altiarchaeota archaeon]|nr:bifunctional diaminohydroxyphosphoribosylaminopyrimidine deaminase/5-amino-6-(5-phosphoribosylamino)uracil reductase RibD [Candidatus Altiarchaeota archaeon]
MASDEFYMHKALELAEKGVGDTSPNPAVGCVIVKGDKIVGQGYHEKAGLPHAEVNALKEAGENANGATLYVTLEPCAHYGRTPPCTEAIKLAGVKKVVAAVIDPNPLVSGRGVAELVNSGIKVKTGILEEEARRINESYAKFITTKMPFVIAKAGMSIDGKIATRTGESRWITGEEAREYVHGLRSRVDAIVVGLGTVLKDDPELTARPAGGKGKNPKRVVVDTELRISKKSRVLDKEAGTIIATTKKASKSRIDEFEGIGIKVIVVGEKDGGVDLKELVTELGKMEVTSLLIEGGGEVHASALKAGIVDKVLFFIAPKIIGGRDSVNVVGGQGIDSLKDAIKIADSKITKMGDDYLFEGYIKNV